MRLLSLFSGIGTTELAARGLGFETVAFCEIDSFAQKILKKRFPGVPIYDDIRALRGDEFEAVDAVCGGFPCQDLSVAGKKAGLDGERSGLWFEMLRIVRNIRPRYVLAENVRGAINLAIDTVTAGLEGAGYEVRTSLVPASLFGAPHQRYRIFIFGVRRDVADALADVPRERLERACEHGALPGQRAQPDDGNAVGGGASLWRTPDASSRRGALSEKGASAKSGDGLATAVKRQSVGQLNPCWVECLQGLPIGWTAPECDNPEPWPGWPVPPGMGGQYAYEPPRTVTGMKNRVTRLKALGNCNPPQMYVSLLRAMKVINWIIG